MRKSLFIIYCFMIPIIILFYNNSWALMANVDLSFLVKEAQYIFYGQVIELESEWDESSNLIFTTVKLSVLESVKARSPGMVGFIIPGGIIGNVGQKNSNSPIFLPDEKTVVFITPDFRLVAEYQGKFHVQEGMVLERGLTIENFIKEIKTVLSNPSSGNFSPRLMKQNTFYYTTTKYHWCGQNPMEKFFYINANTQDTEDEESACLSAALTWNLCGACFQFPYGGTSTTSITAKDEQNIIFWDTQLGYPTLAQTTFWYNSKTNCILEADCEFNDNESWYTNGLDDFDIQTCMLHEFGHYLCLEHTDNPEAAMYAYYGGVKRFLDLDDVNGIKAIYGDCDSQEPKWDSTYPILLGTSETLTLLREYRDRILALHPNGKYQIKCLYSQSKEVLDILISNPGLILDVRRFVEKNMPEIEKILGRKKAVLQDTQAMDTLLENLASRSSLKTRSWLYGLKRKLKRCRQTGKLFFGFQVNN